MKTENLMYRKMRVFFKLFGLSLLLLSLMSVSCSKDDVTEKEDEIKIDYSGHRILGTWFIGSISGGRYNTVTGRYEGAAGMGALYYFMADGTYSELIVNNPTYGGSWVASVIGQFRIKDNMIHFSKRVGEQSNDNGKTWVNKKGMPDDSDYFEFGTDILGDYMLISLDGEKPPLDPETNAAKYRFAGKG